MSVAVGVWTSSARRSHRAVNPVELVLLPGQVIVAGRIGKAGQCE